MPKAEIRVPKEGRIPNSELSAKAIAFRISGFGLLSGLGFRASDFLLAARVLQQRLQH
jgi:hypothetical protein